MELNNGQTYKVVKTSQGDCVTREPEGNKMKTHVPGYYTNPGFVSSRGDNIDAKYGTSKHLYRGEDVGTSTVSPYVQPIKIIATPSVRPYPQKIIYDAGVATQHPVRSELQMLNSGAYEQRLRPREEVAGDLAVRSRTNEARVRPDEGAADQFPARLGTEIETPAVRQKYAQKMAYNPNTNSKEYQDKPMVFQNQHETRNVTTNQEVVSMNAQPVRLLREHPITSSKIETEEDLKNKGVQLDVHPLMYLIPLNTLAVLLLAQTVVICHNENNEECSRASYALPIVMTTLTLLLCFITPLIWVLLVDKTHSIETTAHVIFPSVSVILAVCWVWVTPVITFNYPFQESGNGYFFAWGLFVLSLIFARDVNEEFNNVLGKASHIMMGKRFDRMVARVLIVASLFFTIAACDSFVDDGRNADENTWEGWLVVILGPIMFLTLLIYELVLLWLGLHQELTSDSNEDQECYEPECGMKILSVVLAGLWFFIAIIATFNETSPFMTTGNGYFASWACAMGSLGLAAVVHGCAEEFAYF